MFLNVHINTQWDDSNVTLLERTPETTIFRVILIMNLQNVFIYFLNLSTKQYIQECPQNRETFFDVTESGSVKLQTTTLKHRSEVHSNRLIVEVSPKGEAVSSPTYQ